MLAKVRSLLSSRLLMMGMFVFLILIVGVVPAFAQTEAPEITIPVDLLFDSVNSWINNLFGPLSIGIAIAIALAIIGFVGAAIISAFRGNRR